MLLRGVELSTGRPVRVPPNRHLPGVRELVAPEVEVAPPEVAVLSDGRVAAVAPGVGVPSAELQVVGAGSVVLPEVEVPSAVLPGVGVPSAASAVPARTLLQHSDSPSRTPTRAPMPERSTCEGFCREHCYHPRVQVCGEKILDAPSRGKLLTDSFASSMSPERLDRAGRTSGTIASSIVCLAEKVASRGGCAREHHLKSLFGLSPERWIVLVGRSKPEKLHRFGTTEGCERAVDLPRVVGITEIDCADDGRHMAVAPALPQGFDCQPDHPQILVFQQRGDPVGRDIGPVIPDPLERETNLLRIVCLQRILERLAISAGQRDLGIEHFKRPPGCQHEIPLEVDSSLVALDQHLSRDSRVL